MDKINNEDLKRSIKMFYTTFLLIAAIVIITGIPKVISDHNIKFFLDQSTFILVFCTPIGTSIGYYIHYKRYCKKIMLEKISNKDMLIKIHQVMKAMHWSIQTEGSNQLVFKSSFLRTFLTEYLTININENRFELIGPQSYVEKVVRKLHKLLF